jgi:aromatic-L-amino-acid/L-tryptophan decarboxylase
VHRSDVEQWQGELGDMPPELLRAYGHRVVDWIAGYLEHPESYPVLSRARPGEIASSLPATPPDQPEAVDEILRDFERVILPGITHWNHPGFLAYFAISASAPGMLAEMLISALNVNAMLWRTSPAATELEKVALDWLRQLVGLPDSFEGVIYDTASISTLVAIAAAREATDLDIRERGMAGRSDLPRLTLYCSEQSHSSVEKDAMTLGIGQENVRKIPTDEAFRMDVGALRAAIGSDVSAGARPFCVIATVGTTSTTSVDPVPEIADICQDLGLWLHVDASYAGTAAMLPEKRWAVDGCDRADSMVVNPHKWLFTPIDLSAFYSSRLEVVQQAFTLVPEYLRTSNDDVRNYMDYGPQLGRRFRALKLWFVLRAYGRDGLETRIREHIRLAGDLAGWIQESRDWELMAPAPFSTVCFRAHPAGANAAELDRLNERIMELVNEGGEFFISHTRLHDAFTLRVAIGNIRTGKDHVARVWELLQETLASEVPA